MPCLQFEIPLYIPQSAAGTIENQAAWRVDNLQAGPPHAASILKLVLFFSVNFKKILSISQFVEVLVVGVICGPGSD